MPKNPSSESNIIPKIEALPDVSGIAQHSFRITDLGSARFNLKAPFEPVHIDRISAGKVQVSDEITNLVVVGSLPQVLADYRNQLLEAVAINPDIAPNIRRLA